MNGLEARKIVLEHYNSERVRRSEGLTIDLDKVFLVWFCKTLQNWKALVITDTVDNTYYEVTYDGDKKRAYLDVYTKVENVTVNMTHPRYQP